MEQLTDTLTKDKPAENKPAEAKTDGQNPERYKSIPGWGMDADPENDPTYPMKHYNGADHQRMNYEKAPQQPENMEILQSIERPTITRVFGTSTPPAGLSGAIRRYAYKYSEANAKHWMTLMLADRVDVVQGIISDLRKGIVPNLWVEKGWRAEWKTNRPAMVRKIAIGTLVATIAIVLLSRRRKRARIGGLLS